MLNKKNIVLLALSFICLISVVTFACPDYELNTDVRPAWKQGTITAPTEITVFIDPAWSESTEIEAIKLAFTNWQHLDVQTILGCDCYAVFTYTNTRGSGTYPLTVIREDPALPDAPNARGLVDRRKTETINGRSTTTKATIFIHPSVTTPEALTKVVAHEIGHTFGLGHCPICAKIRM